MNANKRIGLRSAAQLLLAQRSRGNVTGLLDTFARGVVFNAIAALFKDQYLRHRHQCTRTEQLKIVGAPLAILGLSPVTRQVC